MDDNAKKEVGLMIKSLLIASKSGLPIRELSRDYLNECGEGIPYKKFGYGTLPEFLYSLPDIIMEKTSGELLIRARPSEKCAHVANLVREQKSPSKKRRKRPKSAPGRPSANYNLRPTLKRTTGNHYKSTTKINESPEKKKFSNKSPPPKKNSKPPHYVPLCTTNHANIDVRGIPFVVVKNSSDQDHSDKENIREENNRNEKINKFRRESSSEDDETNKVGTLKITLNPGNSRRYVKLENNIPPRVRFSTKEEECIWCDGPSVNGYTLFGDDFFFDYATKELEYPVSPSSNSVGMCKRGITLLEGSKIFHSRHSFPPKICILLGSVDVVLGRKLEDIAYDLYTLINDVTSLVDKIVLCTLPPLLNISNNQFRTLLGFNSLIEYVPEDTDRKIKIIDLYEEFTTSPEIKFNLSEFFEIRKDLPITLNKKGHSMLGKIFHKYLK